jgi:hypothetical protein
MKGTAAGEMVVVLMARYGGWIAWWRHELKGTQGEKGTAAGEIEPGTSRKTGDGGGRRDKQLSQAAVEG